DRVTRTILILLLPATAAKMHSDVPTATTCGREAPPPEVSWVAPTRVAPVVASRIRNLTSLGVPMAPEKGTLAHANAVRSEVEPMSHGPVLTSGWNCDPRTCHVDSAVRRVQ